ncbi:PhnD/SsuA/transferrin family substrate-binding protein [Frateuria defendens]|uniref:PhnD/SsuA/transferrin family substrate-binding protein n=1 Tax=Frateuria defendens TaxID=2219559 RepID=UPI00066FF5DA|nr:PhnD/SsuA/transferrin family substrate-binding protein [Frateuria defendens]
MIRFGMIRFGILPIGSAAESRQQWKPLLDDLSRQLGRPVSMVSVSRYAGLSEAIAAQKVDVAFLSVEAVTRQRMRVVAQFARRDGVQGNAALLIVRAGGPIRDLDGLLAQPGRWRSPPIPAGVLVLREGLDAPLRERLAAFILGYGHGAGVAGERERGNLARIPDLAGFAPAGSRVLRPFVDMRYMLLPAGRACSLDRRAGSRRAPRADRAGASRVFAAAEPLAPLLRSRRGGGC